MSGLLDKPYPEEEKEGANQSISSLSFYSFHRFAGKPEARSAEESHGEGQEKQTFTRRLLRWRVSVAAGLDRSVF